MKTIKVLFFLIAIAVVAGCKKDKTVRQNNPIPNGDFENWANYNSLQDWKTNSCPLCVPAVNTYTVQQVTDAYHGKFAAKFIYNGVYAAMAENKFKIQSHPVSLTAFVKNNLYGTDTVTIKIKLFKDLVVIDSGQWVGTSSITNYTKITIPITQNSFQADSALIFIKGGDKSNYIDKSTEFWVDYMALQ
ncbi:MAG TPA: hypothetical protein VIM16_22925 [Mucilaginibacter sp.]|jgi:hypothetical protein